MVEIKAFYGTSWCSDCKRSKKFLGEQRIPYHWIDIEKNEEAAEFVEKVNNGKRKVPTIVFSDKDILVEPSNAELANKLGLKSELGHDFHDLVIIGGGPAGLTAGLYAARDGIDVVIIEKSSLGGQASYTEQIDNYPGFPDGISGAELSDRIVEQCEKFGVEFLKATEVVGIKKSENYIIAETSTGDEVGGLTMLLATGSKYSRLGVPGEDDLIGYKLHFCSTCDGPFYKDKELAVIGGGNSAIEESIFLARFASKVNIYGRSDTWKASEILQQKVSEEDKITLVKNAEVKEVIVGSKKSLEGLKMLNTKINDEFVVNPDGVFLFIGLTPNIGLVEGIVDLDKKGFIQTTSALMTSIDGLFAAGDVRGGSTKQAVSAMGEGAAAAIAIRNYIQNH